MIVKYEETITYRKAGERLATGHRKVKYWMIEGDRKRFFRRMKDAKQFLDGGADLSVGKVEQI